MKYLLSTGNTTENIDLYILDLFRLYINIYIGDIPGRKDIGFDFILTETTKSEVLDELNYRINNLIRKLEEKFDKSHKIKLVSIELVNETLASVIISIDELEYSPIEFNLQNNID